MRRTEVREGAKSSKEKARRTKIGNISLRHAREHSFTNERIIIRKAMPRIKRTQHIRCNALTIKITK